MGTALAVCHGRFGRASLYRLNKPLAPHAHREGHIVLLVDGMPATVAVDGAVHAVDRGHAVAVSPWQPHEFRPRDLGAGAIFLTLYISPNWFLEMSRHIGQVMRFGAPLVVVDARMRRLAEQIAEHLASGHAGEHLPGLMHELTAAAFEASWSLTSDMPPASGWPRIADFRIRNAVRLMNERVTDACVLDRIARDAGLSRPHFYKLFRQNIGLTPNLYLNTLRLERSIHRLTETDDPVTSIGLDLGFASQASFTRFFCNNIGIAPTDYRRVSLHAA
ncbi:helix-turn-helix domain-containing protein [Acuticoccus mangrovi]|uniref:Helix-turn-helix transcriptional regulator n=1 Tax=Acuticoccus mangrovi TaxID=2796142 RepID=A0A934IM69_9HYPH|nr:AraC family transcriptional regulator [Acuticoccus mangrovi]MBJ3775190.1 helix-turn-helix transcriptional regulator [Acuticoccus mangrovi]